MRTRSRWGVIAKLHALEEIKWYFSFWPLPKVTSLPLGYFFLFVFRSVHHLLQTDMPHDHVQKNKLLTQSTKKSPLWGITQVTE